jgi:hypothetical protein
MAAITASGAVGYWEVTQNGQVFNFSAPYYGSMEKHPLNQPIVGMAATSDGQGYWMVATDGGIFAFGDAAFHGSMGGHPLNQPIVGITEDPLTGGYWEVASDGGIFAFDAPFFGSMGGQPLNQPVVGMAVTADGRGYWMVASDGGIFAFGDAAFHGSMGATPLVQPVTGMATDPVTGGYWMVARDGGIFAFDTPFYGSEGGQPLAAPVVSLASVANASGYWMTTQMGAVYAFGSGHNVGTVGSWPHPYLTQVPPGAHPYLPPNNPPADLAPNPNYLSPVTAGCWPGGTLSPSAPSCSSAVLAAIDDALASEGLGPVQLPSNWSSLSPPEQLFVIADIERVSRGLAPVLGLSATLDGIAQAAALLGTDPSYAWSIPGSFWWAGNWAGGILNPLDADYGWLYEDGWSSDGTAINLGCTSPSAPGCWIHRDAFLTSVGPLLMGAGAVTTHGTTSVSDLLVAVAATAPLPPLVYTWADALAAGAAA